jgi:hypothetical protein
MAAVRRVSFLGGNGHCAARLAAARRLLPAGVELDDVPYPGFEGRPRAACREAFLAAVAGHLRGSAPRLVYATGIGGLIALALRARGELAGIPLILQGAVLWGLERRLLPRLLRAGAAPLLLPLFATRFFRRRFVRRYFVQPPDAVTTTAFFAGYARCEAAPDLFRWFDPPFLRALERDFAARPQALAGIEIWCGGRDRVVGPREVDLTERALGIAGRWPRRTFAAWGHYPMIDAPWDWAEELCRALATARPV